MINMKWLLFLVIGSLFVVMGVGMYATGFTTYLGNDPEACNNCHVMDSAYAGWYHNQHRPWALCNDCHTPHDIIPKYYVKSLSGYHHVSAFLLGNVPPAIRAKETSKEVVQENCIRCHTETVADIQDENHKTNTYCFTCHAEAGHGARGITIQPALITDKRSVQYTK